MLWATRFPEGIPTDWGSGTTTASPNIWRSGSDEVIIVPHLYPTYGGHTVNLVAFSSAGQVLLNHTVTSVRYEITAFGRLVELHSVAEQLVRNQGNGAPAWT